MGIIAKTTVAAWLWNDLAMPGTISNDRLWIVDMAH